MLEKNTSNSPQEHINQEFKLTVPHPCEKNYEEMTKVDSTCRFCQHCSTKVYDFTNVNQEEFMKVYNANKGEVCGLIKTENPSPHQVQTPSSLVSRWWTTWIVSFLTFIGIGFSSCKTTNNHKVGKVSPDNQQEHMVKGKVVVPDTKRKWVKPGKDQSIGSPKTSPK